MKDTQIIAYKAKGREIKFDYGVQPVPEPITFTMVDPSYDAEEIKECILELLWTMRDERTRKADDNPGDEQ